MPSQSQAEDIQAHPQLGVPLSAKLSEGEPSSGHPDGERELAPGIVVVTRYLADGVVMVRLRDDSSEIAGYGTDWKNAVVHLLRVHQDAGLWEGT